MRRKISAILSVLCFVLLLLVSCGKEEEKNTVTITLDPVGENEYVMIKNEDDIEFEIEVNKGEKIGKLPKPEADGWYFAGWYAEDDTEFETKYKSTTKVEEDITLVARWIEGSDEDPDNNITITLDMGVANVTNLSSFRSSFSIDIGAIGIELPKPESREYRFLGWYKSGDTDFLYAITSKTVLKEDTTLVAKWFRLPGMFCEGEHQFEETERVEPTCTEKGYIVRTCTVCGYNPKETLKALGHDYKLEVIPQTCGQDGCDRYTCLRCNESYEENQKPKTGNHSWSSKWKEAIPATRFLEGMETCECTVCGDIKTRQTEPFGKDDFDDIETGSYTYTGGKYTNAPFVNLAQNGVAKFSSYYATCIGLNAIDGNTSSYWAADTLADGAPTSGDWLEVQLGASTDVGRILLLVPNYYSWGLGEGCYVEYKIEAYVDGAWQELGYISDKTSGSDAMNARASLELAEPVYTDKIRATVTHSGRYTPATIYEFEVYGYAEKTERVIIDVTGEASASVSGKYNSWASGAEALTDGSLASYWTTNAREWLINGNGITNTSVTLKNEENEEVVKNITKIVINAGKLVGERIIVKAYIPSGVDGNGNTTFKWEQQGTFTISEGDADPFAYVIDCNIQAKKIRLEVDGYGDPEDGDVNTIKSLVITADGSDITYDDLSWNLPVKTRATLTFPQKRYIACINWVANAPKKTFVVEIMIDGKWENAGRYDYNSLLCYTYNDHTYFTINIDKFVEAVRIEIVSDSDCYTSFVYEFSAYTLDNEGIDLPVYSGCLHKLANRADTVVVAPTCDKAGYSQMTCANCSDFSYRTDATDALGHTWGSWEKTSSASKVAGFMLETCACTNEGCTAVKTRNYSDTYEAPVITNWLNNAPAAWSMTFDDGCYPWTYEWVIPQYQKYGYKATVLMAISMMDSYLDDWKDYIASGTFDIGSHSYNHRGIYSGIMNESNGLDDVNTAYYWLSYTFKGQRILGFATPNGATSASTANFVTSIMAAGRNGGNGNGGPDTTFYNKLEDLVTRSKWGNLNSYISKANQTEGPYEYVKKSDLKNEAKTELVNYVFSEEENKLVADKSGVGTYVYEKENWKYAWHEVGSYDKNGEEYVFRNDNNGEYVLAHTGLGSYERAINILIENNAWTVECMHSLGYGSIYSTYDSTISKFEYLKKTGVWVGSYTEVIQYVKEAQRATVDTVSLTESEIKLTLTDTLDDFMFNQALTIKVDIGDWTGITATQDGKAIEFFIEDGYAYVNAVPDCGEIVITKN